MKTSSIPVFKNYKDSKFSYPKIKRNKSSSAYQNKNSSLDDDEENRYPDNFWNDCNK
jgi:hypothetical protein